jgi:2-amino-4-hydroxy-6-hydroxymethyldihydropteridine diphosphokinase
MAMSLSAAGGYCTESGAGERPAYLSIGSNIEPWRNVRRCLALLRGLADVELFAVSSFYRTRAWGGATTAEFLNLAVGLRTALTASKLLARTQRIELALGRARGVRYGARSIDIDILLIGDEGHQEEKLCVPHPGLLERDFMLLPLLEIAPDARHPVSGAALSAQRGQLRYRQIIERLPQDANPDGFDDVEPLVGDARP